MFHIGNHCINSPYLLAPMAGVSQMPFRVLAFEFGAGLATTELISAKGIFYKNERTQLYLTHDSEKERPYSVQLFGGDEDAMAVASVEAVKMGADIIDINMGCPVKKVTKTGSGSNLLRDLKRAASMVEAMRVAVAGAAPITAKIRTGWDDSTINCVEMAKALEDAGCAAVAVHGRTRAQAYRGEANWDLIRQMKEAVQMTIIGNGDVLTVEDAKSMEKETGCDAVMIGRGALGNPWIFKGLAQGKEYIPSPHERMSVILQHLDAHVAFFEIVREAQKKTSPKPRLTAGEQAIRTFRSHLVWYSRGLSGAAAFRKRVLDLEDFSEVKDAIYAFFGEAQLDSLPVANTNDDGIDYRQAFG